MNYTKERFVELQHEVQELLSKKLIHQEVAIWFNEDIDRYCRDNIELFISLKELYKKQTEYYTNIFEYIDKRHGTNFIYKFFDDLPIKNKSKIISMLENRLKIIKSNL